MNPVPITDLDQLVADHRRAKELARRREYRNRANKKLRDKKSAEKLVSAPDLPLMIEELENQTEGWHKKLAAHMEMLRRSNQQSEDMKMKIDDAICYLPSAREIRAVRLYYFGGYTLEEISKLSDFGVSRERVRQIITKALKRLKKSHLARQCFEAMGSEE